MAIRAKDLSAPKANCLRITKELIEKVKLCQNTLIYKDMNAAPVIDAIVQQANDLKKAMSEADK